MFFSIAFCCSSLKRVYKKSSQSLNSLLLVTMPRMVWCERPPKAPPPTRSLPPWIYAGHDRDMQCWELMKENRELRAILKALIVTCAGVQQQQQQQAVDLDAMD